MKTQTAIRRQARLPRARRGQSTVEYVVVSAIFALILFSPIFSDPLYLVLLNAIRKFYLGFSAGMSMPVSPLGV